MEISNRMDSSLSYRYFPDIDLSCDIEGKHYYHHTYARRKTAPCAREALELSLRPRPGTDARRH